MEENVSVQGERRGVELRRLAEAISNALGVCRVGLVGETAALAKHLIARGMACPEQKPFDAWVLLTDIVRLERGEGLPPSSGAHSLFVACQADVAGDVPLRARVEAALIRQGYIKHPATTELFGYSQLDVSQHECWALFDFRPVVFADGDTVERLKCERDLHSDMLREPGVRSDAHVVRYQLAASLVRPGDTVLDAACGLGYGSHVLASLSPAARVTGIDLSNWAVDYSKRNYGGDRVDFICGSLPDVLDDVSEGSVDFVVSLETLEHVPDPVALLAGFERVLKPGGRIFVSVPNDWADETGKDPNPHHLHVYDWPRLKHEIETHFIVESAWSLAASGCKTGQDRMWRAQPRKLESVALVDAPTTEGEWWLVCATKSPLAKADRPYEGTVHAGFVGRTHLVDFANHYDCPWLVHSLVELPWRIRDKTALAALASDVITGAHPGSADLGAGLAVLGWRVLEDSGAWGDAANEWLRNVNTYLAAGIDSPNPHVRRWCVSLNYLLARFLEARGEIFTAIDVYRRVADADVLLITPTLGTKLADAALRAGALDFREGRDEAAVACWQAGLNAVFRCLQADPIEFIGNPAKPFIFAMNDLVEIADGAARLANAIGAVTAYAAEERATAARQLGAVTHRSLRSALAQLQEQVSRAAAEINQQGNALSIVQTLAHRHLCELEKVQAQLTAMEVAKANAEQLAIARYDELGEIARQLDRTDQAKAVAEELAHRHLCELEKVQAQLTAMEVAKAVAEQLAMARYDELGEIARQLDRTDQAKTVAEELAHRHLCELEKVQAQLTATEIAKAVAEQLAMARYDELGEIARQLDRTDQAKTVTEELAHRHLCELEKVQAQLTATEVAKAVAEQLAMARYDELGEIARQFDRTDQAKTVAEELAHRHLCELEKVQAQLTATEVAKAVAEQLAMARYDELGEIARQLDRTDQAKTVAEELAHRHLCELEKVQAQLTATEVAKAVAEQLAMARYDELGEIARQLDRTDQAKTVAEELAHRHLCELEKVQAQLTATEVAKAVAEQLAMARHVEFNLLWDEVESLKQDLRKVEDELDEKNERLTGIQNSVGYNVLATLRLVPSSEEADV